MASRPITLAPIPGLYPSKGTGEKPKKVDATPKLSKPRNGVEPVLRIGKIQTRITASPATAKYVQEVNQSVRELEVLLRSVFDQFLEASPKILLDAMEPIFDESQAMTPVDTGDLIASGYLESTGTKKYPRIEIGYGKGGKPFYTAFVHERLDIFHEPPTMAKFLEIPVRQNLGALRKRIDSGYRKFMASGEGRR
jgi:hypothetical protein